MTKLTGLAAMAGALLLATAFNSGAGAAVPAEVCKAQPIEAASPVVPATDIQPANPGKSESPGCPGDQSATENPDDAVCVYRPGMENERAPATTTTNPQVSTVESPEGWLEQAWTFAAQVWSAIETAARLSMGARI